VLSHSLSQVVPELAGFSPSSVPVRLVKMNVSELVIGTTNDSSVANRA